MISISTGIESDIEALNKLIIAFNLKHVPFPHNPPWRCLSYVIKENEEFLGGIYGHLFMDNVLNIDVMYINEKFRNRGYGAQLLKAIEEDAKNEGAYLCQLDTFDFQGLSFYKKQKYEVFGVLENCPAPGHQRYYLKKQL